MDWPGFGGTIFWTPYFCVGLAFWWSISLSAQYESCAFLHALLAVPMALLGALERWLVKCQARRIYSRAS